jgi:hypothetical protein
MFNNFLRPVSDEVLRDLEQNRFPDRSTTSAPLDGSLGGMSEDVHEKGCLSEACLICYVYGRDLESPQFTRSLLGLGADIFG